MPESLFTRLPKSVLINSALALFSAILLLLVFPPVDAHWLAPIALTPLLFALARTPKPWQRFFLGWGVGIFYWFFLCNWIQFVLETEGNMGFWGSWLSFALFAVLKGLHMALFAFLAGFLIHRSYAIPAIAALWTGLERTHSTFGFTWLDLGNAGIQMSLPLRLAPITGVYGLSFVFAMLSVAIALVLLRRPRLHLAPLLALPLLWLLPTIPEGLATNRQALMVQPNIDPATNWNTSTQDKAEHDLVELSSVAPTPLVIWPELPAPLYYYGDPDVHQDALNIARAHGYFLFETVAWTHDHRPLNSAVLLGPDTGERGRYDKIELVPFGEYVPPAFAWVNRITQEAGDFVPGESIKVLPAGADKLGVFICYEAAFPDLVRQFAAAGANVLVNLSNDAYFGHSPARAQHLLIARMRAVENRRFLIRSTNDGLSAVIDPAGKLVQQLTPYKQIAALIAFGDRQDRTIYTDHGDWFAWSCLVSSLALCAANWFKQRA